MVQILLNACAYSKVTMADENNGDDNGGNECKY